MWWAPIASAERVPDDATADYPAPGVRSHQLRHRGAAAGLLDEALALDVRRPQDYLNRMWAQELANLDNHIAEPDLGAESA